MIIGGRGTGASILELLASRRKGHSSLSPIGFFSDVPVENYLDLPVLGPIMRSSIQKISQEAVFISGILSTGKSHQRLQTLKDLGLTKARWTTVLSESAFVSKSAVIGVDVVVMPGAFVGPNVRLGDHSFVGSGVYLGHDSTVGEGVFLVNNASVNGGVSLGAGVHVGNNSSIGDKLTVGDHALIGMGATVTKSVHAGSVVVGNPARPIVFPQKAG